MNMTKLLGNILVEGVQPNQKRSLRKPVVESSVDSVTEAKVFKAPSEAEVKARHKELMAKYNLTPETIERLKQAFAWEEASFLREDSDVDDFYSMCYYSNVGYKDQPDYQILLTLLEHAENSDKTPEEYAEELFRKYDIE